MTVNENSINENGINATETLLASTITSVPISQLTKSIVKPSIGKPPITQLTKSIGKPISTASPSNGQLPKAVDHSLTAPSERTAYIRNLLIENPCPSLRELEYYSDYLVFAQEKEEKRLAKEKGNRYTFSHEIITPGRAPTIQKRETSYQGLAELLKNEDAIQAISFNDKNRIMSPKVSITDADRKAYPFLQQMHETIEELERSLKEKTHTRRDAWFIRNRMIIPLRRDQYLVKEAYQRPIRFQRIVRSTPLIDWDRDTGYQKDAEWVEVSENCLDFRNPLHVAKMMKGYADLAMDSAEDVQGDVKYILWTFEDVVERYLREEYPMFYDVFVWRIDRCTNKEISEKVAEK